MNYGSICSGVEAASLAWKQLGWKAKFFAEVEPFPSAVLQQKFGATKPFRPLSSGTATGEKDRKERETWAKQIAELPDGGSVPNLGDFTQITTKDYDGAIDLLVGGTPCQSYSIAGLRKGLADPRGNLALEFVKLAYRTGVRWTLWENVPGVLSSSRGEDFASFLSLLCGWEVEVPKDGWRKCGIISPAPGCFGLAWRILDAQYTRVSQFPRAIPQRRRRLFVVGYLGSWEYPAQVLFDGEMRGGDSPPRRTKRQGPSSGAEGGIASADTIRMRAGGGSGGKGALIGCNLSHTLATGNDQTIVTFSVNPSVWTMDADRSNSMKSSNPNSGFHMTDVAKTLDTMIPTPQKAQGGQMVLEERQPVIRFWNGEDVAGTLTVTGNNQLMPDKGRLQCVVEPLADGEDCFDIRQVEAHEKGISPTLMATDYKGGKAVMEDKEPICFENHGNDSRVTESEGISPTITSRFGTGGNNVHLIMTADTPIGFIKNDAGGEQQGYWDGVFPTVRSQVIPAVAYNVSFCDANGTRKDRPDGGLYVTEAETSKTVTAGGTNAETVIVSPVALDGDKMAKDERKGGSGLGISTDGVMYTQTVKDVHAVAYEECVPLDLRNATRDPEKHDEMNRQGIGVGADGDPMNTVTAGAVPGIGWQSTVRRLLPVECERLMGFPDGHTLIQWKGKPESECPDAPRYKACGNSMCVNVMAWVGERIDAVEKKIKASREASRKDGENHD